MATQQDYAVGAAAAQAYAEAFVKAKVPGMFEGTAEGFITQMIAPLSKAVIDAVDASRAKGA
jgi:hypothetical protein